MQLIRRFVNFKEFAPNVLVHALDPNGETQLPESAAVSFIRNAAILFAKRTGLVTAKIKIDLQCGLSEYPLEMITCENIIGVKSATMGHHSTSDCGLRWCWGDVNFYFEDNVLHIHPAPNKDIPQGLEVEVVLAPSRDSCEVDERLYEEWHDAIVNGALVEVHMMAGYPWSSTTRADYRRRLFNEDTGYGKVEKNTKGARGPLQMLPNPNFMSFRNSQRRF